RPNSISSFPGLRSLPPEAQRNEQAEDRRSQRPVPSVQDTGRKQSTDGILYGCRRLSKCLETPCGSPSFDVETVQDLTLRKQGDSRRRRAQEYCRGGNASSSTHAPHDGNESSHLSVIVRRCECQRQLAEGSLGEAESEAKKKESGQHAVNRVRQRGHHRDSHCGTDHAENDEPTSSPSIREGSGDPGAYAQSERR